ncbi:MAG: hypothetical protein A2V70_19745 [Planctomycetes bacterium RBG_13_63_9]|nr:MAG: hypothetical protein A2V70_19745 [Planctomycetes bacterium RBG_13_63_9]
MVEASASTTLPFAPTLQQTTTAAKPLSLRANFLWMSTGNAVQILTEWGRVVVLAHLGNLEMIGLVVLAFAVCSPVIAMAQLGLRTAVVTDAKHHYQFGDYLALRLVTTAVALLVMVAIVLAGRYDTETVLLILLVGVAESLRGISDIYHALIQRHERMDQIAISHMTRGALALALLALGVWLTGNVLWGLVGFPLVTAAILFGYDLPNGLRILRASAPGHKGSGRHAATRIAESRPRWHARTLLRLLWLTLPLGVILTLVALATSLPRCMVSHYLGNAALGVFVSIAYLGMVGARVVGAIAQSAGPRLSKHYAAGRTDAYLGLLGRMLTLVLGLGGLVVLVVAVLGVPILGWLCNADFTPYWDLAILMMVAAAVMFLTIPLGMAVEAMRRFKTYMVIRGVGIAVLLALLPGLIEAYGLRGAAAATLAASASSVLGCAGVVVWAVRGKKGGKRVGPFCARQPSGHPDKSDLSASHGIGENSMATQDVQAD